MKLDNMSVSPSAKGKKQKPRKRTMTDEGKAAYEGEDDRRD